MNNYIKSWIYVSTQLLLLVLLIFFTNSESKASSLEVNLGNLLKILGFIILVISIYNLRKSLTALPLPKENGVLQVKGLYKYVRHPMYLGVITLSSGIAVASGSIEKYIIVILLYFLFLYKAKYEEKLLIAKYPKYKDYIKKTRSLIPIKKKS